MVYLVIIVVIAGAGIGRLWWIQRRHATSLQTVDGFRSSLERLSAQQGLSPDEPVAAPPTVRSSALGDEPMSDPYLEPLDPARRAAAKRRLEARRRGALRSSDLRSR
ncbi:MAG TPA: hypothetical protein VHV50_02750 [Actinomycetota bacterium]|nr:hypothetical protein [Actinomycetota bacterium]